MSVSSTDSAISYAGNNSDETAYSIPFKFEDPDDISVAVTTFTGLGIITSSTSSLGFIDWDVTLNEGMESEDLPEPGDQLRDEDENRGTVVGVVDNEDGTCVLRIIATAPFSPAVSSLVSLVLPDELSPSEFTITHNEDGTGSLVTDVAVLETKEVFIYRQTPIVQSAEFPTAGRLDPAVLVQALDRQIMICQELSRRIGILEGGAADSIVVIPSGSELSVKGSQSWADSTARSAAVPAFIGQVGVQLDNNTHWTGTATTAGSWTAKRFQLVFEVYGADDILPSEDTGVFIGKLAKPVYIKEWSIYFLDGVTDDAIITLNAGAVGMGTISGGSTDVFTETTDFPNSLVPASTFLTVDVSVPDYSGSLKGLRVILHCEHGS